MNVDDIKRVLILGAGTMGHQIGFLCAVHGCEVVIYDSYPDIFEKVRLRLDKLADDFCGLGILTPARKGEVIGRITFSSSPEQAASEVDLVSESVPEDPRIKAQVFGTFNALCPERTIFTTNTSSLVPSMYAAATGRPEKFVAFHFHDILLTRVVDIMAHPGTAPETIEVVDAFARKLGQVVITVKKESAGYVFNAMLGALLDSAITLVSKNVACLEDVDRAWMGVMHSPTGPFGIMDSIGLDTFWRVTDFRARATKEKQLKANADFLKSFLDQGKLGKKSGEGFYRYPRPLFSQKGFLENRVDGNGRL
ncbi:MAG: 3-hydroxyacyl-CoA dehydrogenase [Syntrophobacteraceae bacterium]